eukprot:749322-Hanusia_phi.AAC.5
MTSGTSSRGRFQLSAQVTRGRQDDSTSDASSRRGEDPASHEVKKQAPAASLHVASSRQLRPLPPASTTDLTMMATAPRPAAAEKSVRPPPSLEHEQADRARAVERVAEARMQEDAKENKREGKEVERRRLDLQRAAASRVSREVVKQMATSSPSPPPAAAGLTTSPPAEPMPSKPVSAAGQQVLTASSAQEDLVHAGRATDLAASSERSMARRGEPTLAEKMERKVGGEVEGNAGERRGAEETSPMFANAYNNFLEQVNQQAVQRLDAPAYEART